MAITLNYRGNIKQCDYIPLLPLFKENKLATFVEWGATGFKVELEEDMPSLLEGDEKRMSMCERQGVMIGNNTSISRFLNQRMTTRLKCILSKDLLINSQLREWRRSNFKKQEKIWNFWKRITWMYCMSNRLMNQMMKVIDY